MNRDFNNINKQIAGFIVVSAAVMAPVIVSDINGAAQAEPVIVIQRDVPAMELRYAGPEMLQPTPNPIDEHFAEPEISGGNTMIKVDPKIYVARYAGPETPDINNGIPPIVRYAGPQMPSPKRKVNPSTQQRDKYGLSRLEPGHYIFK